MGEVVLISIIRDHVAKERTRKIIKGNISKALGPLSLVKTSETWFVFWKFRGVALKGVPPAKNRIEKGEVAGGRGGDNALQQRLRAPGGIFRPKGERC